MIGIFFIRFQPTTGRFIFVHYDSYGLTDHLAPLHGKAIALDINDKRAPIPTLFLVHEYMVRGRNFYQPKTSVEVTDNFQDWIINDGVLSVNDDGQSFSFRRDTPARGSRGRSRAFQAPLSTAPSGSRTFISPPTAGLVEELLAYQRTMPSWKAWQKESMGWEGTAEENTKKYVENVGVD